MRKYILLLISIIVFLSGCLKNKETIEYNDNTSRLITEFTNGDSTTLNTLGVAISPGLVETDLTELRIPPRSVITKDVEVTIELNPGLVTAYNDANSTTYSIPPSTVYAFDTHNYTLTPTSKSTNVKIRIDPNALVNNEYALGFTITSVSDGDINLIKRDYVVELIAKNDYDGEYHSNGFFYHPTAARVIDQDKPLSTLSLTSVLCEVADLGGNGYYAVFEVDASNNVTITEAPGASGAPYTMFTAGLPTTNPGYTPEWPRSNECNNTYDPAAEEFRVRYGYMGPNGWRVTEEVLKRN
ncbi:MAG: DUF1735 domain-containing protein [Ferruginibacter sp.]